MSQITIYLDDNVEKRLNKIVKKSGLSKSRWLSNLIQIECKTTWPNEIKNLAGTWGDFPSLEEIRSSQGNDFSRESF